MPELERAWAEPIDPRRQEIEDEYEKRELELEDLLLELRHDFESTIPAEEPAPDRLSQRDEFVNRFGAIREEVESDRQDFYRRLKNGEHSGGKTDFAQTLDSQDGVRQLLAKIVEKEEAIEHDRMEKLKKMELLDTVTVMDAVDRAVKRQEPVDERELGLDEAAFIRDEDNRSGHPLSVYDSDRLEIPMMSLPKDRLDEFIKKLEAI